MGDVAAVTGVVLLLVGITVVALLGDRRSGSWVSYFGILLAVLGLGIELAGAVAAA